MTKTIICLLFILNMLNMNDQNIMAQDLSEHNWKNRIVLVFANDTSLKIFNKQLEELGKDLPGILDRKIVIYKILPNKYQRETFEENKWETSSKLFNDHKQTNSSFEVVLIGLDGGIKLSKNELLTTEELFSLIDSMPMRSQELKNMNSHLNKD